LDRKFELLRPLIEGRRVLEVGCGIGSLTRLLVSSGLDVLASDVAQNCVDEVRKKGIPTSCVRADICDDSFWDGYEGAFDSVLMSEVLEHIHDTESALRNTRRVLKERGILLLTVPGNPFLYSGQDVLVGHVRRYTRETLTAELRSSGLKVEMCRHWNVPGFFGWLIGMRLMKKGIAEVTPSALNHIYGAWLSLEDKIDFGFGLTLVAKARKTV
jgi:SAM-dependent methyltransferase